MRGILINNSLQLYYSYMGRVVKSELEVWPRKHFCIVKHDILRSIVKRPVRLGEKESDYILIVRRKMGLGKVNRGQVFWTSIIIIANAWESRKKTASLRHWIPTQPKSIPQLTLLLLLLLLESPSRVPAYFPNHRVFELERSNFQNFPPFRNCFMVFPRGQEMHV